MRRVHFLSGHPTLDGDWDDALRSKQLESKLSKNTDYETMQLSHQQEYNHSAITSRIQRLYPFDRALRRGG